MFDFLFSGFLFFFLLRCFCFWFYLFICWYFVSVLDLIYLLNLAIEYDHLFFLFLMWPKPRVQRWNSWPPRCLQGTTIEYRTLNLVYAFLSLEKKKKKKTVNIVVGSFVV